MKINALDAARHLIKADVVEALKTRTIDRLYSVVWDQKVLFPAHEQMFLLHPVLGHQLWPRRVFREGLVGGKSSPVLPIDLFIGTPLGMLCDESVLAADNFALKVRREARMVFRQSCGMLVAC